MKYCALLSFLCIFFYTNTYEYLYPIAPIIYKSKVKALLLYQKANHTELLKWNPLSKKTKRLLLSSYNPAGVAVLPDESGFSFLDNGRIHIKRFLKRSPKSLEFELPLYDITRLFWIDQHNFYFSAKEHRRFGIYHANDDSCCICLYKHDDADCLYPQKIGTDLFFIQRRKEGNNKIDLEGASEVRHQIMHAFYPTSKELNEKLFSINYEGEALIKNVTDIIGDSSQAFAFLTMKSKKEGYFLAHPLQISDSNELLPCKYYKLYMKNRAWKIELLFSFSIPLQLLFADSQERIYESILPLLPKLIENKIYFAAIEPELGFLALYAYNLDKKSIEKVSEDGHDVFCPVLINNQIFYGGSLDRKRNQNPSIGFNQAESTCVELPLMPILPDKSASSFLHNTAYRS